LERNLSQCHFVHHKSHMDRPGFMGVKRGWHNIRGWLSLMCYIFLSIWAIIV
jgi:hypothetical protein